MPFRFSLESVLRLRCSIEHQQELLLQAANNKRADIQRQIQSVERVIELRRERRERQLATGSSASLLHFELVCESILAEYHRRLESERAQAEQLCLHRAEAFRNARRDREILDSIRESKFHQYLENRGRRQQRELDDLLLMRRELRKRG